MTVPLGERSYPIHIGDGLLRDTSWLGTQLNARKLAIVTNRVVAPLYAGAIHAARSGEETYDITLPDGETHKTLATASIIFDQLIEHRFARDDLIVALGGGVIGDMAGFTAACFQRGIAFVQIPTTLLSQVDSSVGGKTGVNHHLGKNMIGALHQPRAVIIDVATLTSLSLRELRAGLAEVVKYGLICDAEFFGWLESNAEKLIARNLESLAYIIHHSCKTKASIVVRDEHEQGERVLLNFGHTFGHAIESSTGYSKWLHGEAVAAGMLMAASLSERCGLMKTSDVARISNLLQRLGLRTEARGELTPESARMAMGFDKKVKDGKVRLILLRGVGYAFVSDDYPTDALIATLDAHLT